MSTETYLIRSPFSDEAIGEAPDMTVADAHAAIASARAAFPAWSKTTWAERTGALRALRAALAAEVDELARLIAAESGFLVREAQGLMRMTDGMLAHWSSLDEQALSAPLATEQSSAPPASLRGTSYLRPHGVVACITPFNASILGAVAKISPAILAGNTVVLKPAPQNPLATLRLMQLIEQTGFPQGVVNLVTGRSHELGEALVSSPQVRMVSFTGSTAVGVRIQAEAAKTLKRTALELGGKGALVVLPDADLDDAAAGLSGIWTRHAGQLCSIPTRAIVHQDVYDAVVERLVSRLSGLNYARGEDDSAELIGPVISYAQRAKIDEAVQSVAPSQGTVHRALDALPDTGSFVPATLIEVRDTDARPFREEMFGPVLCITRYSDIDEAIAISNDTEYGLANYVFTGDIGSPDTVALIDSLESGNIVVNGTRRQSRAPFGGMKLSGIGREGPDHSLSLFADVCAVTYWEPAD